MLGHPPCNATQPAATGHMEALRNAARATANCVAVDEAEERRERVAPRPSSAGIMKALPGRCIEGQRGYVQVGPCVR